MAPIIRQHSVDRQASATGFGLRIKMGEWMIFLGKLGFYNGIPRMHSAG
ncbi:hypothetical protein [Polynucleobacter sp. UB-Piko-W3]|nr:hypothetical protein [Polynucleobacter sp. UB-Piko-W3]